MPILHICGILLLIYFYLKPMLGKYDEKLQKWAYPKENFHI